MKISLKTFLHFLKKENCLKAYIESCKKDKFNAYGDCLMLEYLQRMCVIDNNKMCDKESLVQSFSWSLYASHNGINYNWHFISEKWRNFVMQHESK